MDYSIIYQIINLAKKVGTQHFEEGCTFGGYYIEYMGKDDAFFVFDLEEKNTLITTEHNVSERQFVDRSELLALESKKTGVKFVFERNPYIDKKH